MKRRKFNLPQAEEPPAPGPRASYHVEEAAALLGIGRTFMFALIRDRKIRVVKIGRRTLVPATEITAFLERMGESRDSSDPFV